MASWLIRIGLVALTLLTVTVGTFYASTLQNGVQIVADGNNHATGGG
jgi:hypothetical protein